MRRGLERRSSNLWDCEGQTTQAEEREEDEGWATPRSRAQGKETAQLAQQTSSCTL